MTSVIQVGIIGGGGKLGKAATAWIGECPDLRFVGAVGPDEDWQTLGDADVVLEVTRAGLGHTHGMRLLKMGLRPVIGTSGVSQEQTLDLDRISRRAGLGGIVIPNFSLGMLAMRRSLSSAMQFFSEAFITEAHGARKADAPSGTARELCEILDLSSDEVVSVRVDGLTAAHEVRLKAACDELVLRHESLGPESFKSGVLASIRYAATAQGISSGLEVVLAEACKLQPGP